MDEDSETDSKDSVSPDSIKHGSSVTFSGVDKQIEISYVDIEPEMISNHEMRSNHDMIIPIPSLTEDKDGNMIIDPDELSSGSSTNSDCASSDSSISFELFQNRIEPKVAKGTYVLTEHGYRKIEDVAGREIKLWGGETWVHTYIERGKFKNNAKKVTFTDGSILICSRRHRFLCYDGENNTGRSYELKNIHSTEDRNIFPFVLDSSFLLSSSTYMRNAFELGKKISQKMRDKKSGSLDNTIDRIMRCNEETIKEFLKGIVEGQNDECIVGSYGTLRSLQLLLRSININNVIISKHTTGYVLTVYKNIDDDEDSYDIIPYSARMDGYHHVGISEVEDIPGITKMFRVKIFSGDYFVFNNTISVL